MVDLVINFQGRFAARVQKVQKVQRVQRVQGWWWRLCRKHKRGAAGAAGCVEGLYRRVDDSKGPKVLRVLV